MYVWYARRFGWTPAQVDELPAWLDAQFPVQADLWDQVQAEAHDRAQATS